jgi:hypothetical protein
MNSVVEAEVVDRSGFHDSEQPRVRLQHVKVLGVVGTLLALLTMSAAFGLALLLLFAKTLVAAAAATLLWPLVFSSQFTAWVFGSEQVSFWKLFLLFLAAGTILKMFRPVRK